MENTKKALSSIPLLKTKAGPRDVDLWPQRLKEEYQSLIQVRTVNNLTNHGISYSLVKSKHFFFKNNSSMFKTIKQQIMIGFV